MDENNSEMDENNTDLSVDEIQSNPIDNDTKAVNIGSGVRVEGRIEGAETSDISGTLTGTLKSSNISPSDISAIGMHGQTISHKITSKGNSSIQLGCPTTLSRKTSISVVSDFRQTDINNGGQGAPLAPLFHDFLFQKEGIDRIIVNIGGISNISFLSNKEKKVFGFDLEGYSLKRIYAFLAERYLSYWFQKYSNHMDWPIFFFDTNKDKVEIK